MAWILQLGNPDGSIKADAAVRILAAMIYPGPTDRERKARSRFIKRAPTATLTPDDVSARFREGAVAGDMLLTLLQQHLHDAPPSLNEALDLVRGAILYDSHLPPQGFTARQLEVEGKYSDLKRVRNDGRRIHRNHLLSVYRQFGRVAHVWAAYIYGAWKEESDYLLSAERNIPKFVSTAEAFAYWGQQITLRGGNRRLAIDATRRLRLKLPPSMDLAVALDLPRISETAREQVTPASAKSQ